MKLTSELEEQLREGIRRMTRKTRLWRILKDELSACGHWKNLPRGVHDAEHFNGRMKYRLPDDLDSLE